MGRESNCKRSGWVGGCAQSEVFVYESNSGQIMVVTGAWVAVGQSVVGVSVLGKEVLAAQVSVAVPFSQCSC